MKTLWLAHKSKKSYVDCWNLRSDAAELEVEWEVSHAKACD
jgi:hypothetical protein